MEQQKDLAILLQSYSNKFPQEAEALQHVNTFIEQNKDEELYNRYNYTGHITASAFVYQPNLQSLLLIHHITLNRWLQPGGHVELTDDNLLAAALREVEEETGISTTMCTPYPYLFDIDSHPIPPNDKKGEPAHYHHDFRYLLFYNDTPGEMIIQADVSGCAWRKTSELLETHLFEREINKIKNIKQ